MEHPILSIQQATKVYGGGFLSSSEPLVALDQFSLDIDESQPKIVTIAGESGSGKTTLSNLILNFTSCTEGKILYRGINIAAMTKKQKVTKLEKHLENLKDQAEAVAEHIAQIKKEK